MSASGTQAPTRARRRSRFTVALSLLLVVALAGSALVGGWLAVDSAQNRGMLGGPIVVPEELRPVIRKAAKRCDDVPIEVFAAQIAAESGWDPDAVSPAGARGIAQFMPAVWDQYGIDANDDGVADIWDPVDAIHSAAVLNCINRRLVREASGNRLHNTLAAYNAGFGSVLKYDGVPPFPETETYVERILRYAETIVLSDRNV
jgi:soluble lytic murein transglycosylase-like protein